MQVHSTAASKPAFKPRVRRLDPGRYLVESQSRPGTGHPVTADYCPCKGFSYRGTCRHTTLVAALEPAMRQWYGQATAPRKEEGAAPGTHVYGIVSRPTPAGSVRKIHYSIHDKTEDEFYGSYRTFEEARDALKEMPEEEQAVVVPMTAGGPSGIVRPVRGGPVAGSMATNAARRLAQAYRALADAHEQSDERAVLLRRVDELERQVAADNYNAMRQAA